MNLKELTPYVTKITNLSFSELVSIFKSYGIAGIQSLVGLPWDNDEGGTKMTQKLLLSRRKTCDGCTLQTSLGWCNPNMTRAHVSKKNADGTPLMVKGCACALPVKQRDIKEHCPAGEW